MKDIRYIVWDWNGTLIDDVGCAVETMNMLLKEYRLDTLLDEEMYKRTFCFPVVEYYRTLGFDVEDRDFSKVAERFVELYDCNYKKCDLHQDVREIMKKLREEGFRQIILSASEKSHLLRQVANFEIEEQLDAVLGIDDIYANSKEYLAVNWLKENAINPDQVLFVGDTVHDYEVASRSGCHCVLISRGHQDRARLEASGSDLLERHEELMNYILQARG